MKKILLILFCFCCSPALANIASLATLFFENQFKIDVKSDIAAALFWSELRTSPLNHFLRKSENNPELLKSLQRVADLFKFALEKNSRQKNEQILFLIETILRKNNIPLYLSRISISNFKEELGEFIKTMPPGRMVIKFFFLSGQLKAFLISSKGIELREISINYGQLIELVKRIVEPFEDYNSGQVDLFHIYFDLQAANQLYRVLLKDFLEKKRVEELIIIPDRILFSFPLELLVVAFQNKGKIDPKIIFSEFSSVSFLVEKIAISYSFSLFELLRTYKAPEFSYELAAISVNDVLLSGKRLLPLRQSYLEAANIKKIYGQKKTVLLYGKSATQKKFSELLANSRYVHLITHLQLDEKSNEPALLFSRGSKLTEGELFPLFQLRGKMPGRSEMLFLSCCQSLQNYFLINDLFHELSYFFRRSQIRSAVLSFWAVNEFHSELVYQFYLNLHSKYSFSRALQQAKLKMIRSEFSYKQIKYSYAHPFLWANLCLYVFYNPYL